MVKYIVTTYTDDRPSEIRNMRGEQVPLPLGRSKEAAARIRNFCRTKASKQAAKAVFSFNNILTYFFVFCATSLGLLTFDWIIEWFYEVNYFGTLGVVLFFSCVSIIFIFYIIIAYKKGWIGQIRYLIYLGVNLFVLCAGVASTLSVLFPMVVGVVVSKFLYGLILQFLVFLVSIPLTNLVFPCDEPFI